MRIIFSNIVLYNVEYLKKNLTIGLNEHTYEELCILAYKKWGVSLFSHLDGDYAFALYDAKTNSYFAARDPLGIKALYYTKTSTGYHFASTVSELLTIPSVIKKPNLKSVKSMLGRFEVAYEDTMFEGIYRIPPGYVIRITNNKLEKIRYWYPEKIKRDYSISSKEASDKLYKLLSEAIDKRVDNLDTTAFEVSGGLDSSSIVSLLSQKVDATKIESFSMQLEGLVCDEGDYVDSIIKKYGINHKKIPCQKLDYADEYSLSKLYHVSSDWPIRFAPAMKLKISSIMQKANKSIIITGQGGDQLFGRNPYTFYDLFIRGKFLTLYRELRYFTKPFSLIKKRIIKHLIGVENIEYIKRILFNKKYKITFENEKIEDFSDKIGVSECIFKNDIDAITSMKHITILDANFLHPVESHFNIEFRHPFYDLALVEFALSLPPRFNSSEGQSKWILRKAMKGILPEMINNRKDKAEFSDILEQHIEAVDVDALLKDAYLLKLGIVSQEYIDAVRAKYAKEKSKKPVHPWMLINMEYWYRFNFEKESLVAIDKKETV